MADETEIAWLKQLRMASWRDVPFQVDTIDITAGSNTILREYPFQDLPTVFKMSNATEEIKFSAYLIGDDYLDQLDALRAVLEGDGVLIHPTQGSIRCYYHGKYTIKESPAHEGGIARLDLTFIRAEERRYPVAKANSTDKVSQAGAAAQASAADKFGKKFDADGAPGWSLDNMRESMRSAMETAWSTVSKVQKEMNYYDGLVKTYITNPTNELLALKDIASGMFSNIMRIPDNIASSQALTLFGSLRSLWSSSPATSVASAYQSSGITTAPAASTQLASALTPVATPYQTASRQKEAASLTALSGLIEATATISAAQAVTQVDIVNYDQALALRQDFNQQFSKLLRMDVVDHDTLLTLHTAVLADLQERSRDLARVTTYTPETWQPVVYISYRLFGTVRWADEIMAMNPHILNPLLVPPGKPLRIIKRD
ncbi:multidrug DMT transporter [Herbaspirillum lusitanum]|uniref:DNA circularization protein n=1 Tax=Herbaspirillum lusitanum TaxID=213312 RepID=UPI0022374C12|nr:DNA circularization N-terminal domain-containing protein [Herbaspirillum lusitanum]MCW5300865.1 multidrug DMT transporter [Herbaspirillum lusitanum]